MIEQRITIVGLGLMGGSLALALRPHVGYLAAVDSDEETLRAVQARGVVDAVSSDFAEGIAGADVVVLATPVRAIIRLLADLPRVRPDGCMVLDLGSTKAAICQAMDALPETFQAIGGHPMCGRESAGLAAATAGLYQGQTFLLCPTARTTPAVEQVALELIAAVGGRPFHLAAAVHDELVALTSHLPYLAAAVLMQQAVIAASEEPRLWTVSGSGFRDTARLSGSDPRMMLDILLTNRPAVLAELERYQALLAAVAQLLRKGDELALAAWLASRPGEYGAFRIANRS